MKKKVMILLCMLTGLSYAMNNNDMDNGNNDYEEMYMMEEDAMPTQPSMQNDNWYGEELQEIQNEDQEDDNNNNNNDNDNDEQQPEEIETEEDIMEISADDNE